jgi:hypothetical protein
MMYRPDPVCTTRFREPPNRKSAEWLTLLRNGGIEAESYDFSEAAHACLGSDVAWILTLEPSAVRKLAEVSQSIGDGKGFRGASRASLLWITQRCASYREFRELLDAHEVPYSVVFDGYA